MAPFAGSITRDATDDEAVIITIKTGSMAGMIVYIKNIEPNSTIETTTPSTVSFVENKFQACLNILCLYKSMLN